MNEEDGGDIVLFETLLFGFLLSKDGEYVNIQPILKTATG